jgi:rod shape-determining protein MreC
MGEPVHIPSLETGRDRLSRLLDARVQASVFAPGPIRWARTVLLDVGASNNVSEGDSVVVGPTLVGTVAGTGRGTCTVRLVDDLESRVEARCARTEECIGSARGVPGGMLLIDDVPVPGDIREGDAVLSSSLGGQLPDGLIIGTIEAYHRIGTADAPAQLRAWVLIRPAEDLGALDEVCVLRTSARREGDYGA